jgi:hypothetical protein
MRFSDPLPRFLVLAAALALALPASAAAIYGKLKRGNQPVAGATLKLVCPGGSVTGSSNAQGDYNLSVAGEGRCAFSVGDKTTWVVLSSDPARYDFEVPADAAPLNRR